MTAEATSRKRRPSAASRERMFISAYLADPTLNERNAAVKAGYSAASAYTMGKVLLQRPNVVAALAVAQKDREARTEISADIVLKELAKVALSDIRMIFDEAGRLKHPTMLDEVTAKAVSAIDVVTTSAGHGEVIHTTKIRMHDKLKSLEMLARHLELWHNRVEVTGAVRLDLASDPGWMVTQAAILRALEPFVEAKRAVIAALAALPPLMIEAAAE